MSGMPRYIAIMILAGFALPLGLLLTVLAARWVFRQLWNCHEKNADTRCDHECRLAGRDGSPGQLRAILFPTVILKTI